MAKQFVVVIGYERYTGSEVDIIRLLAIASRMTHVKQADYSGPYYPHDEPTLFVTNASLEDIVDAPEHHSVAEPAIPAMPPMPLDDGEPF